MVIRRIKKSTSKRKKSAETLQAMEKEYMPWLDEPIPKQDECYTPIHDENIVPELAEMEIASEPPTDDGESVDECIEWKIDDDSTDKIGDGTGVHTR
jgi:hypothetical protein